MNTKNSPINAGSLLPFSFDNIPLRGKIISLKNTENFIPSIKNSSEFIQNLLKQCLTTVVLFQQDLKANQSVTLQLISDSTIKIIIAQSLSDGTIKAYADVEEQNEIDSFKKFIKHNPRIIMTVENKEGSYKSIIPINKDSFSESIIDYYEQSVQNKTYIQFTSVDNIICGLMLQHLPTEELNSEDWNRVKIMSQSLKTEEVQSLDKLEILKRLFAEDTIRVYDKKNLEFYSQADRARMLKALKSLGVKQCAELLKSGDIEMTDQFSGLKESFTKEDIKDLFKDLKEEKK